MSPMMVAQSYFKESPKDFFSISGVVAELAAFNPAMRETAKLVSKAASRAGAFFCHYDLFLKDGPKLLREFFNCQFHIKHLADFVSTGCSVIAHLHTEFKIINVSKNFFKFSVVGSATLILSDVIDMYEQIRNINNQPWQKIVLNLIQDLADILIASIMLYCLINGIALESVVHLSTAILILSIVYFTAKISAHALQLKQAYSLVYLNNSLTT